MKQRLCGFSVLATVVAALSLSAPATAAENQVPFLLDAGDRLQANDDSADRAAREQARRIEGVWLPIVTVTDCETQAVIATFPSMDIYVRGGGFVGFGAVQKSDQVGMGAWRHDGGRNYVSQYNFFGYAPAPPRCSRRRARRDSPEGVVHDPAQCCRHGVFQLGDSGPSRLRRQRSGANLRAPRGDAAAVAEVALTSNDGRLGGAAHGATRRCFCASSASRLR